MPLDLSIFYDAAKAVEEGKTHSITSLSGSSGALLFSLLKSPSLLLCSSDTAATRFYSDSCFWSGMLNSSPPVLIEPEESEDRLKGLIKLYEKSGKKFIASVDASLSKLWEREEFPLFTITEGASLDRDRLAERLRSEGYIMVQMVAGPGEMSMRGGIFDLFPANKEQPVRIEFFGDEIESLRIFDLGTQLSVKEIKEIQISPLSGPETGPTLLDLLSESRIILNEPDDIKSRYPALLSMLDESDHIEGNEGTDSSIELKASVDILRFNELEIKGEGHNPGIGSLSGFGLLRDERKSLDDFVRSVIEIREKYFILMVCSSEGQAKRLKELFFEQDLDLSIIDRTNAPRFRESPVITTGRLTGGFSFNGIIVLAESDIFGQRPAYKAIKKSKVANLISSIEGFKEGDHIVHIEHGIGQYIGIRKEKVEGSESDFIIVEYLGGDRLLVPLENINYIQKYNAPGEIKPKLDKLGGKTWQKTRRKVKKKIRDMAEGLLKIYARRTEAKGYAFSANTELHREFDDFFPYEETPDQLTSIDEIRSDMELNVPMDRLLCGDVGYGKTEVIMRACFKAVFDSKQVTVLVPTTILAEQHYETFIARFSAFPVKIDFLSRFKSRAEQKQTLKELEEGGLDIIIGTHRLLAKDVIFLDLGLLVIDEEHKFGVAHKEKVKSIKENVDVLTLSATPIPRTLHMAISGIRGMSTIETPPEERMAVKSAVMRFNPVEIGKIIEYEVDRGGQAFFVHNRIHDIYEIANMIRKIVPGSKVGVAHGQMKGKELEHVMHRFFHQEINVLVSTSIVSSGLDVPSANTIIINRADRFGLADLYQLRGRVGRSNIRAYAYFLIPGENIISEDARKKLKAIQELGYLGAGFRLALKDLEIRGAGNLLGGEQSGHIEAVGFDMYMEMLESAVSELKGEKRAPGIDPRVDLKVHAHIPDDYIEDPDLRLGVYRKIASAKDAKSLEGFVEELKDIYGSPPEKTRRLVEIMELKAEARNLGITKILNSSGKIKIIFDAETPVSHEKILSLYNSREKYLRFLPEGGVELDLKGKNWNDIYGHIKGLMEELQVE